MRSLRGFASFIFAVSVVAGCASGVPVHAVKAVTESSGNERIELTKLPPTDRLAEVASVAAPAANQAWAVGQTISGGLSALADRWNGSSWRRVAFPRSVSTLMGPNSEWDAVASNSQGSTWIFGQTGGGLKVWVHIQSGQVHVGRGILPGGSFISYAVAAGTNGVWAFRNPDGPSSRMWVWHYAHGRGVRVTLPGSRAVSVVGAAAVSATNVWAVGNYSFDGSSKGGGALFHYFDGRWQRFALPQAMYSVSNVVACGPDCAWVGGGIMRSGRVWQAVARWNGSSWHLILPPAGSLPRKIKKQTNTVTFPLVADGRGGFWGSGYAIKNRRMVQSFWHYSSGTWKATRVTKVPVGDVLASVRGTTSFWAEAFSLTHPRTAGPILALVSGSH